MVVGVDGSEQARVAVLEAASQAERLGATLRVICAVPQFSGSLGLGSGADGPQSPLR